MPGKAKAARSLRSPFSRAQLIVAKVPRDSQQPGPQVAAPKILQRPVGRDKRLLGDVLGRGAVTQDTDGDVVDLGLVLVHDLVERGKVAVEAALDQIGFGGLHCETSYTAVRAIFGAVSELLKRRTWPVGTSIIEWSLPRPGAIRRIPVPDRATNNEREGDRGLRALVRELIETVLLALAVYLALQFSIQPYRVEGSSMTPGLGEGEYLLVNKMVYWDAPLIGGGDGYIIQPPRFGDVVIFQFPVDPTRNFVKRVIGVPGDSVRIEKGVVFVNGRALEEPYVTWPGHGTTKEVVVPPDSYFVLGDNRRASEDSRSWGMVSRDNIIGRAWVSYWPPEQLRELLPFY